MDTITRTILYLEQYGFMPKEGQFDITEELLRKYIETYSLFSQGNGKYNYSFARKLAGLSFMKIKRQRGGTYKNILEGFVYIISNKAWPEFLKIGMTIDTEERIKSYQVYSPLKDFKIEKYAFVLDRRKEEKELLKLVPLYESEWVPSTNKTILYDFIDTKYTCMK